MSGSETEVEKKKEEADPVEDAAGTFQAYAEYNKTLRTWFVAFGVGGPALFLVNEKLTQALVQAGQLRLVVILFLVGATAQVIGAFLNKVANWYVYQSMVNSEADGTLMHRACEYFVNVFWPDILLDLGSIASFGYAAWLLLTVFAKT
jgi:hypothetical protein